MISNSSNLFEERKMEFRFCEKIIQHHSKSFYAAFSQLPRKKAQSIYAIYAFCRMADDIVDKQKDPEQLHKLYEQLQAFELGNVPNEPMWLALEAVFKEYTMDITPFYDMLTGQRMDFQFQQPNSIQELLDYAYYVAGSVGLMLLPILSTNPMHIIPQAKKLGEAMQLSNILRDIGEDFDIGRIYLPKEEMMRYGVTIKTLAEEKISSNFIAMWESLANLAEQLYNDSLEMLPHIEEDARKALLSAILIYKELIPEIRRNKYNVFDKKHAISKHRKLQLILSIKDTY
jgi:Phytoene/squalene synthetase